VENQYLVGSASPLGLCLANIQNGGRRFATQNQIAIDSKMPRGQLKPVSAEKRCFTHDKIEDQSNGFASNLVVSPTPSGNSVVKM
jgi:hypothetical protein